MKKKYSAFDEATAQYTAYTGAVPEAGNMIDMYHCYRNEWKAFDSFLDWLMYHDVPCSE